MTPGSLGHLRSLHALNLKENFIGDIEVLMHLLRPMTQLRELDLTYNPVQKVPKYRDHVIMICHKMGKEGYINGICRDARFQKSP